MVRVRTAAPVLLLMSFVAACGGAAKRHKAPEPPADPSGLWALADGSTTVMTIVRDAAGKVTIDYRPVHTYTLTNEVSYIEPKARVY